MAAVQSRVATSAVDVPFDLEATVSMPNWRQAAAWSLSPEDTRGFFYGLTATYLRFLGELPDTASRDVAILASNIVRATCGWLVETALCLDAAAASGLNMIGGPPEVAWLRGDGAADRPPPAAGLSRLKPAAAPRAVLFRSAARIASWAPLWRVPGALFAPQRMAISHNAMLLAEARRSGGRLGFRHAELYLAEAQRNVAAMELPIPVRDMAQALAAAIVGSARLNPATAKRLHTLIAEQTAAVFELAAGDLAALRTLRRLPLDLWSGTGGYWPSRAIGLEVLRRGGTVTRFDHGGSFGMLADISDPTLREFTAASRYLAATPEIAAIATSAGPAKLIPWRHFSIEGIGGDEAFAAVPAQSSRPIRTQRRVIYAPTLLRGARLIPQPWFADNVYLDWQLRLAEAMKAGGVDLLCKPHPEGLLRGKPHPLADVAATLYEPFERVMDDADAFIFDFASTTAFWKALCTDRPIVFIDLGMADFAPKVADMIARRCRVLKPRFDDRNRPILDTAALIDALTGGPDKADPSDFRRLLAGTA